MDNFSRTISDLKKLRISSAPSINMFDPIFRYFKNSSDFELINIGKGISTNFPLDGVTHYFNGEEEDKNKFEEYISSDRNFIVKITILDLRIAIKDRIVYNGFSLEEIGYNSESIPVFRIVAPKK